MTVACATPERRPTAAEILDTPLPRLLAEFGVELHDSSVTDSGFFGAFVERRDGARVLAMPTGRTAFERDTMARMLLAEALGLEAPPVPMELAVSRG
ncbi:hypothetical protein [Streptomyces ziwulingensis]|uniref:Aminoglycoside phosphotransferase n=1 Tax=Streptomyces ziwulingensis TaxID=1045501 RepID=A0ABP9D0X3_9ACTN